VFESLAGQVTDWLLVAPVIACFAGSFIGGTVVILAFATFDEQIIRLRTNYGKRDLLFFIAIKFAYGLRIAQILLLGAAHYPWSRFLALDGVAVAVINTAAVLFGWMFGRGVTRYLDWFENTGTIVSSLAVVLPAFIALRWLVNRYMLRKR
jgi:membrane protein DedA with SNARE-associated domain